MTLRPNTNQHTDVNLKNKTIDTHTGNRCNNSCTANCTSNGVLIPMIQTFRLHIFSHIIIEGYIYLHAG